MTTLIKKETSFCFSRILDEENLVFDPISKVNGIYGKYGTIEYMQDTEDGTFPDVEDYVKLAKEIDREGAAAYLNCVAAYGGKNDLLTIEMGGYTVLRQSKWDNEATIYFAAPIKVLLAEFRDEQIIREVQEIKGEFTHEFYWMKKGRQQDIANCIEIWFDCKEYI